MVAKGWNREGLGVGGDLIQTTKYIMDEQQGPTDSTKDYSQYPIKNLWEKNMKIEYE